MIEETKAETRAALAREYLGHAPPECRVRIDRDGYAHRYGSPDPFDRSADFWTDLGHIDDLLDLTATN